jgi:hypothetical protein
MYAACPQDVRGSGIIGVTRKPTMVQEGQPYDDRDKLPPQGRSWSSAQNTPRSRTLIGRQKFRVELERRGDEVRLLGVGHSVITCSAPEDLADTLEQGLADQDLRVFRESNRAAGTATLTAYRFTALPPAKARAFERWQRLGRVDAERRGADGADPQVLLAEAMQKVEELLPIAREDRSKPLVWVAVFDAAAMTRSEVELLLLSEQEADAVLPVLARAWGRKRREIEIKPPAIWG